MFHSVRARLTAWYTAILALVLITFGAISYAVMARAIRAATDSSLADTAREFAAAFSNEPAGAFDLRLDYRYSDRDIMVFTPDGRIVTSSRPRMTAAERQQLAAAVRGGLRGLRTVRGGRDEDGIRVSAVPLNVMGSRYIAVVAQSLHQQNDRLENAARAVFFGIPLALLLAAGGGYLMARKSLAPVTEMSVKARQIGAETLDKRIAVENERDELGFLALTLNDLLERLQRSFESQRRFMADASHELRTPIAIIQGEADVVLSRTDRTAAEYRASIEIIRTAAVKLTRIVQNLFLLARTDAGGYPMRKSPLYLDELIADCVRSLRNIAAGRGVSLRDSADADMILIADEELLHRMMLNLIDNALKFTAAGGNVIVHAARDSGRYVIRVTDTGPGIAPADQTRIFDRFYRVSRTAEAAPGAGLGLPIARWIAEAHGGRLSLERSDPTGSTFLVVLPHAEAGAERVA